MASFQEPVRITQLADAPSVAPGRVPANIEEIRPGELQPDATREPPESLQIPFQSQLPRELITRPPSPETRAQFERFIPKVVDPQNTLNLLVGQPRILNFADWAVNPQIRLYLPDNSIARWDILSETEVAIIGLAPGSSVLTLWFNDPTTESGKRVLSYRIRVFEDPDFRATIDQLEQQIQELFPDSHVKLSVVRDRLVVRGQAKDALEAGHILTLLAQTRSSRVGQSPGTGEFARESTIYLDQDRYQLEEDAAIRRSVIDPVVLSQAGIVNLLEIPGEQQVTLRVTLAEVNRSALRTIGADMQIGGSGDVSFLQLLLPEPFGAGAGGNVNVNSTDFRLALNALRRLGYARTLAEPNLTTLNGRPAMFQAGDTFPVPLATAGFGGVGQGVQQEFVGVRLQFVPFIVDRDRIRLQVQGQVSARDDRASADVGGTTVPGTNTRDFFTTVELRDGQTLALAGLLQNTLQGETDRVPFAGDLPVIGTLFSQKRTTATEQELVVVVTPELTHPLEACQTPPVPGADVHEPTDVEFFLLNRMESRRAQDFRSPVRTDYARIRQFERCCYDRHIIGPAGHTYGCCQTCPPAIAGDPAAFYEPVPAPQPQSR